MTNTHIHDTKNSDYGTNTDPQEQQVTDSKESEKIVISNKVLIYWLIVFIV